MVRGGCLPVRGSESMTWKYEYDKCRCGPVLFACTSYGE